VVVALAAAWLLPRRKPEPLEAADAEPVLVHA